MIVIRYDDREKFPWALWIGDLLWRRYRTRRGSLLAQSRLECAVVEIQRRLGDGDNA